MSTCKGPLFFLGTRKGPLFFMSTCKGPLFFLSTRKGIPISGLWFDWLFLTSCQSISNRVQTNELWIV